MADQEEDIEVHTGGIIAQAEDQGQLPAAGGTLAPGGRPTDVIVTSTNIPPPDGGEWTLLQQHPPQNADFQAVHELVAPHPIPAGQAGEVPMADQAQAANPRAGENFYSVRWENEALKEEIRRLRESTVCKICLEGPVSVLVPCGHLYCCHDCANGLDPERVARGQERRCPVCRRPFSSVLGVYFA